MEHATATGNPEALAGPSPPNGIDGPVNDAPSPTPSQNNDTDSSAAKKIAVDRAVTSAALSLPDLEERVRRLEDGLAQLQDTRPMEARVLSRVLEQVGREPTAEYAHGPSTLIRDTASVVIDPGRQLLPVAVNALETHAAAVETRARTETPAATERSWLLLDLYADLRTLYRMCRDPLYRTIWLGRALLPLGLLLLIISSWVWLYFVPGFGLFAGISTTLTVIIVKIVDLFLAFVLYKVLQREIRRYRGSFHDSSSVRR